MLKCEIRADNTLHIEGYVNAVERDSKPVMVPSLGRCVEQVRAGVFGAALAENPDVELLENHDHSRKLGSTSDGVLTLSEDSIGLRASADISDPDMITKARTGQLKGWSFGFVTTSSEVENRADNIPRRVVTGMKLSEVSLIDGKYTPCYAGTLVEVRAVDDSAEIVEFRADEDIEIVDYSLGDEELRYNPYHDPSNGRFCSGGGGGGGVLVVEKGQKGKGYYVVDAPKNEAAANEKYKGISYVGTDGKKRMYIEQNGQYFSINSNGYTERLPDNMQKRIKSEGGLSKAFGKNASPINDDEVSELKNKYKSQPKIDYELGNPFNEKGWGANRKKSIYRPRNVRAFGLDENEPEEQRSLADEVVEDMDNSPENEAPSPDYSYYERAMKLLELRYNPYHDPSNGRFCSGGGGGGGGMIVVPKGGKAYGVQINKGYSDEEIDSMYQKYIEEQKVLDNSDKRPYNGVKIERDYKSSAAKFCGKEVYDKMCDDIERCDNKDIAELYASCINDVKFKSSSTKRDKAYYSPQTDTVVITKIGLEKRRQDPQDFERTALHEIGHYIDFHNSENGNWYASQSSETLLSALNNDSKAFVLKYCPNDAKLSKDAKGKQGLAAFNSKYGNNAKTNGTVNISDMVYGSTGIKIYGGHDANYFKISGTRETEALAEIMQSRIMNSKADSILRAEMPRSSASVEILAKSINGRRKQTNDVT